MNMIATIMGEEVGGIGMGAAHNQAEIGAELADSPALRTGFSRGARQYQHLGRRRVIGVGP